MSPTFRSAAICLGSLTLLLLITVTTFSLVSLISRPFVSAAAEMQDGGSTESQKPLAPVRWLHRTTLSPLLFDKDTRSALRRSGVAVLVPSSIPPALGPIRQVAVIDAGPRGYYVGYSSVAGCSGALACSAVHFAGFARAPQDEGDGRERTVRLADGRRARFRPSDCSGASCSEASLSFERAGAAYEIDAKAGGNELSVLEDIYRRLRQLR